MLLERRIDLTTETAALTDNIGGGVSETAAAAW